MQTPLLQSPTESESVMLGGFRLQRFEVLNWGTFDQRPWVLNLNGETGLLTGANGSGKSTLVDGLITLLVPNKRRSYNQASSGAGKRERDEKSYVQGAYGRTRSEESYGSKPRLLREKGTLSVLLAYFQDQVLRQDVTLAQVLWMEDGSARKFFVLADREMAISTDFTKSRSISDLKKSLKAHGAEIFDEFSRYSQKFRKQFGLQSEKALDLFNQTVSIKEIGGLNDFVRNHMLEKADMQTKIRELQESYENLTVSHEAILKARKQLASLEPLTEDAKRYEDITKKIHDMKVLNALAPAFFAWKKLDLLKQELQNLGQELTQLREEEAAQKQRLEDLRNKANSLEFAIKQDTVGQRLQELKRDIEQCGQESSRKKRQAESYDQLAKNLGLTEYRDRDSFYHSRQQGEQLQTEIETALKTLEANRDRQKLRQSQLQEQKSSLLKELDSLRQRKSQIPVKNLEIRDRMAQALHLTETDLPFVGELLQVRPEYKAWQGAIERLLRGFGLCVLVPDTHYQAVNTYVNQTNLKGKLVYHRVASLLPNPTQRALDPARIPSRLSIKQNSELFFQWLREYLSKNFNYVCCETLDQFHHEARAITLSGLIKHGGDRHEKDDRKDISDRSQYILGWNNADKIKSLEKDLSQVTRELDQINQEIRRIESQQAQERERNSNLERFMSLTDFMDIDWRFVEAKRLELEKERQSLEASSDRLKDLEAQLEKAHREISKAEAEKDTIIQAIGVNEQRQKDNCQDQRQCRVKLHGISQQNLEMFGKCLVAKLRKLEMSPETINQDEEKIRNFLQGEISKSDKERTDCQSSLTLRMVKFKQDFAETTLELDATMNSLPEYLKLKEQIERDDLPRHEEKFRVLMNEKVIIAISIFKNALDKQEEDIEEAIENLNQSLKMIDYTDSTYIHLRCDKTRNREVRDFREDIKSCLGDVSKQSAEDNEERFYNIKTRLIERFKSEDRWTKLVTDVRNWLDFSVSERYRSDDSEKEHHTDSSGKSGGQKVKLAYTILASAIAYQFGLNGENAKQKSFRFVVIDEAFSKSDDNNARYAMELFKNLNLQLLVVTPKDKINVIESYLSSLHFISNTPEGDDSKVVTISIDEYRRNRQAALNTSRD